MDWERIRFAVVWFVGALVVQASVAISSGGEAAIPTSGRQWLVFASNAFVAAVAKWTSSTKMVGTNPRPTEAQKRAYLGLPPKQPED